MPGAGARECVGSLTADPLSPDIPLQLRLSGALALSFGEVIDDPLVSQMEGAASIRLLLLLWCIEWFLGNLALKRRKP